MHILAALLLLAMGGAVASHPARAQFDLEESHTTASLRGISAAGPGVAWASGSGGTVRRTEDGGFLWQYCTVPPGGDKLDFRAVQGFDANTALVMSSGKGALSRVFKTTDGCQTWKEVFVNPDPEGFFDAMIFTDPHNGMILGDPVNGHFVLLRTSDGGATWRQEATASAVVGAGAFAASNTSLLPARGASPAMFGTGGPHTNILYYREPVPQEHLEWSGRVMPAFPHAEGAGVFSLARGAGDQVVAVGGDYTKPAERDGTAAYRSNEPGSWFQPAEVPPGGYRSAVAYDPAHNAFLAVGPNGADVSFDDGRTWQPVQGDHTTGWNAISLPFVVGAKGQIGKVRDEVWTRPKTTTPRNAK